MAVSKNRVVSGHLKPNLVKVRKGWKMKMQREEDKNAYKRKGIKAI